MPVTLDSCDREPIHIPGAIQPHGALLAFDRLGHLSHFSANAADWLGSVPALGERLKASHLGGCAECIELIGEVQLAAPMEDEPLPRSGSVEIGGRCFDLVVHASGGFVICEFEHRAQSAADRASFAQRAYRSIDRLKRQRSLERLLELAVDEIRSMTGFDRVMAYRFRHDESGDVVAESRREDLEPYLGRRYPASDIPAQARRLYVLNTLRLIADVTYEPVPLLPGRPGSQPLDLSHSVLRSVSPIHTEYLRNMGVAASMSVSIVVSGHLWGMIACHHMAPLQVPYATRLACDLIAQLLASTVQSLEAKAREAAVARAAWLRTELVASIQAGDTVADVLSSEMPSLMSALVADALIVSDASHVHVHGDVDEAWAHALLADLGGSGRNLVHITRARELPLAIGGGEPPYCGVLALGYDPARRGWLVALRREQIQTIRWGGRPEKEMKHGPLGPRLTPRGSFAEWRETVRGTAAPWDGVALEIAGQLLDALSRAHAERVIVMDRARSELWAVLGHDLRNPLQSISMAAHVIGERGANDRMNKVLRNSTKRMLGLISDVMDMSRLQSGIGLGMNFASTDLARLVEQLVEEIVVAHPETLIERHLPATLQADVDAGRMAQLVANLLSNARHHGSGGPITVDLRTTGETVTLTVRNFGEPIPADLAQSLFEPFKHQSQGNERNPTGMGLGLYIADQIIRGHRGEIGYRYDEGQVEFRCTFPQRQPA